jgi:hypothetical protein
LELCGIGKLTEVQEQFQKVQRQAEEYEMLRDKLNNKLEAAPALTRTPASVSSSSVSSPTHQQRE